MDKSADSGAPWTRGHSQVSVLALSVPTSMWAQRAHLPRRNKGARRVPSWTRQDRGQGRSGIAGAQANPPGTRGQFRASGEVPQPAVPGQAGTEQGSENVPQAPPHNHVPSPQQPRPDPTTCRAPRGPQEHPLGCEDQTGREQAWEAEPSQGPAPPGVRDPFVPALPHPPLAICLIPGVPVSPAARFAHVMSPSAVSQKAGSSEAP